MKMLKFTDTEETDAFYFPAANCEMIEITNNTSVIATFKLSGDNAVQNVDLTCTADKADEVAAILADYIGASNVGNGGVFEFLALTAPVTDVTGIATTKAL